MDQHTYILQNILLILEYYKSTPPPLLVRSIKVIFRIKQYAKGRYAVSKNPVISYADINFYI